ncbi:ArsR/SmtB family transcription factor [Zhihengliuella halotolerans]|uniref:ArsR/SmtB family transcription factor n=1 Tax=Zhihengliuella halotolerans TaxID=370736 RepID=UPI000C8051E6|nr:metalloregulator ArsR/SmtB family transcription factor [Zhihengliuella halotolerans]
MNAWNSGTAEKADVFDSFAEIVKAVANGRRLELLELMAQGEHAVDELARATGAAFTTTSAHLQTLKRAGLVATRREGNSIRYRLAGDDVAELYTAAKRVALARSPRLREALESYLGPVQPAAVDPAAVTAEMFVLDVRPREEYDAGHFVSAVSIPLAELEDRYREIPDGARVVVYCRGELCRMAREAAAWLRERGIDAAAMVGGVVEWRASPEVRLAVA